MATLPYNPTTAFKSPSSDDLVFIARPGDDTTQFRLFSVNVSSSLVASDLSTTTISENAPFAENNAPFTLLAGKEGRVFVFSGDCGAGADGAKLWSLNLNENSSNGEWEEMTISTERLPNSSSAGAASYLANGMTFSANPDGNSDLYVFGGLCPNSTNLSVNTWQGASDYSNTMIALESTSDSSNEYAISTVFSSGPPIPEAGFSVTPLSPTFSNTSDGDADVQQNFVLLGGQTQTAFINMSGAALYSLPQRSWSFIPIEDPSSSGGTELARRDEGTVDPRSGHTATLTEDGEKVIVYGGWVGDLTGPATPQLAILEVGDGYGGSGTWKWTIPKEQDSKPDITGLYGHGAIMLPGNVLMITGGYTIPGTATKLFRRQESASNQNTYFFNVSSNSWINEYSKPSPPSDERPQSGSSDNGRKIGLGVGLGVGLALLLALILAALCLWRKKKLKTRAIDDRDLQGLSLGDQRVLSPALGYSGHRPMSPDVYPWAPTMSENGQSNYGQAAEAERTGLLREVPSPTRGLRRSLHSRPTHWPEDGRRSRGSNFIHPIDEREEYESEGAAGGNGDQPNMIQLDHGGLLPAAPILDPFRDPQERERHLLDGSRSPSPQTPGRRGSSAHNREMEMQNWEQDWAAAAHKSKATGRISPDRSDRTSSTLSNQSSHSMVSALSYQPGDSGSISRSLSQRSTALFSSRPLSSTPATGPDRHHSPESQPPSPPRPLSLSAIRQNRSSDGQTPGTSFPKLQMEGQALLGGSPGSPSKQPRPKTWNVMGSVRRAFGGSSPSTSPTRSSFNVIKRKPVPGHSPQPSTSSATDAVPQRSASTGATIFRRQQGARDWGASPVDTGRRSTAGRSTPGTSSEGDDADWDVESAVERRVVQLMFTVPKEKLRVVNAGPDGDGNSVVSMEGVIGTASVGSGSRENDEVRRSESRSTKGKGKEKAEI